MMMNSHGVIIFFIICFLSVDVHTESNNFIITDFGGISDGKTDNKLAFANAWKKACATPGGTISVPKGNFLVSDGDFEGPCNGPTRLNIDGTMVATAATSGDHKVWLTFDKVDDLTIFGTGTLDGNGASTWSRCKGSEKCGKRPRALDIVGVTNALIQGKRLVNSKMFHVNIHRSKNVKIKNVNIFAPKDSPNTDGIHISRSDYVTIEDSNIGTGDDCVSIGDGSRSVSISGVFCGPGHGISIGSLGKYKGEDDVSEITVKNCTISKTQNGLRIKTWAPSKSSTVVSNVTFTNIKMTLVDNPIIINQYYCPSKPCSHNGESSVAIKGVKYINVHGSSSIDTAVNIQCSKSHPCEDVNLVGVRITHNGQPTKANCSSSIHFQGMDQVPPRCQ